MEVLSSRVLVRPTDPERSHRFYGEVLGLAVMRDFGAGRVYFLGGGAVEVSGRSDEPASGSVQLWVQVRDVAAEWERLRGLGVDARREPRQEPWGLVEAWIADPDGVPIVLVEIPDDHPLRRDVRSP